MKWPVQSPDLNLAENLWIVFDDKETHYSYQTMEETRRVDQDHTSTVAADVLKSFKTETSTLPTIFFFTAVTLQNISCNLLSCYSGNFSNFDHCVLHKKSLLKSYLGYVIKHVSGLILIFF